LGPVVVGDGCLVGANSVLTKSTPAGSTIVGIPAKVLGQGSKGTKLADHDVNSEAIANLHERLMMLEVSGGGGDGGSSSGSSSSSGSTNGCDRCSNLSPSSFSSSSLLLLLLHRWASTALSALLVQDWV